MEMERFATSDLTALRHELKQSGLDSWQAAELISSFLAIRGYGVSNAEARTVATRLELDRCSLDSMQSELERLAMVM
jgi:hypothetical protein